MQNLTSGVVHWEPDFAIGLAQKLDLAITLSPKLYAKDIDIALKIITTLFDYESKQNSSTLVSARTKEFAKVTKLNHVPPPPGGGACNPLFSRSFGYHNLLLFKNVIRTAENKCVKIKCQIPGTKFLFLPFSNLTAIVL